ncbi:JAB domain-containing protein [Dysosmobacter sp.]|uniref:JAB domain-containing protein n=1 Tax=Dysosmobacter sp. TaxID=2591382 RepID=UPI002A9F4D42|nr:DNA repair protein RadC [Dysosmobacter sp.]MDY5612813.1 DNA repair protein RadC [Dysosmobacter sp.]
MRSRFLSGGLEQFADHEALELLLYYAIPRRDTNPIAHALMDRYGSLSAVLAAPVEDLQKVEGVGENAAILLKLVPRLCAKARLADADRQELVLNTASRAGAYLLERFYGERNEVIYQLCLDRKGKLLACKKLGEGSIASAALDVRKLVENAILHSAGSVVLAHNHPSGIASPSVEDYAATDRARAALETIGVALADHIIVADGDFVSLAESGYLEKSLLI